LPQQSHFQHGIRYDDGLYGTGRADRTPAPLLPAHMIMAVQTAASQALRRARQRPSAKQLPNAMVNLRDDENLKFKAIVGKIREPRLLTPCSGKKQRNGYNRRALFGPSSTLSVGQTISTPATRPGVDRQAETVQLDDRGHQVQSKADTRSISYLVGTVDRRSTPRAPAR